VVEVLHRHGRDHGIEMIEVMEGLGYHDYEISTHSGWKPSERISGDPQGEDRDWLLVASRLSADFSDRYGAWERSIEECTADRNSTASPQSAQTTTTQGWAAELRCVVAGVKRRLPASR
jgi:hypothetical protein